MEKRTKLTLKGIDESTGKPFIKEIHSLDEVKKSGCYTVIARDASTQEGMASQWIASLRDTRSPSPRVRLLLL
ncbi:MAG: hypothetical protein IKZ18_02600 [Bacteroidaceae bacterium]|nr:hypothetical protein [Bacteroidaceae bacterium]